MNYPNRNKYIKMEHNLQFINTNFVTLREEDEKKVTPILHDVIQQIVSKMAIVNPLFNNLFQTIFFGGSYYDDLKVGTPEEFDIDLILKLPKLLDAKLERSNLPGFVKLVLPGWDKLVRHKNEFAKFSELAKYKDENHYLLANKIRCWMESIITQTLNKFVNVGNIFFILCNSGHEMEVVMRKNGPAVAINISSSELGINMDVDLVASFKMNHAQWPQTPFRSLPRECRQTTDFLVVPKEPKNNIHTNISRCLWRLSFQEQERILMNRAQNFKPALRLMKKLRDTQTHLKISSYFLKTMFLWENEHQKHVPNFWSLPISFVFMHMLKTYRDCLEAHNIPYFWNKNNNLLGNIEVATLDNFKFQISRMIDTIDKKVDTEPEIIASYLSTPRECEELAQFVNQLFKKAQPVRLVTASETCDGQ